MAPKFKRGFMRKRETMNELRASDEFSRFLCDTPSTSNTSPLMKLNLFLDSRNSKVPTSVNSAEKCERLSETRELKFNDELKRELDEIRERYARFDEKIEMIERKRKAADEKSFNDEHRTSLRHNERLEPASSMDMLADYNDIKPPRESQREYSHNIQTEIAEKQLQQEEQHGKEQKQGNLIPPTSMVTSTKLQPEYQKKMIVADKIANLQPYATTVHISALEHFATDHEKESDQKPDVGENDSKLDGEGSDQKPERKKRRKHWAN